MHLNSATENTMKSGTTSKNILITFARSFHTLELARQLHAQGHKIFVIDSIPSPISSYSNAVHKSFTAPSPRFHPEDYIHKVLDVIEKEKIDLLIPIYEEISYLSKAMDLFPRSCKLFFPPFDLFHQLQNKWLFQQKLKELGIPILKAALIKDQKDFLAHPFEEYALKPCYSRASQRLFQVSSANPMPVVNFEPHNPWIAQEWAKGKKYCTYSVCYEGTVNAYSVYPVTYAIDGNSCVIYEAVDHPEILTWVTNFVKKIGFTGQIAFDFIEAENGQLYALECNPRATSGLLLFRPEDRLDLAFLQKLDKPIIPPAGRRQQVAMGMMMYGWRKSAMPDNNLCNFMKMLFSTQDVVFRTDDLKPFLLEPMVFGKLWLRSKKLGLPLPVYFTHDHDWNGESLEHLSLKI